MAETDLENQAAQAQDGKSPEASPEKKEDSANSKAKAMMSLVSVKRHLLCQDIASAVTSLGEACELLAQEFGEKAPECAEAYFYYGKALLEAARLEFLVTLIQMESLRRNLKAMMMMRRERRKVVMMKRKMKTRRMLMKRSLVMRLSQRR